MEDKTKELVNKAKNGDQTAFAGLYEAYYQYTFLATKDILSSYEEREDVTQEAFTKVFQKIQAGDVINNFGGLMNVTAKNIAKDHIKAREAAKRPQEVYMAEVEDNEDDTRAIEDLDHSEIQKEMDQMNEFYKSPEEAFEEKEVSEILKDILSELPDYQQEALTMFYMEQMTYPEIAELYGESVNTIKSRVNQGKKKVEAKILDYEKKNKIKLHSFAPLTFFFYLLRQKAVAEAAAAPAFTYSAGAAATASGTSKGILGAIKHFFSKSVKIAGKEISTKVVAGVVVATVGVGSAGVVHHNTAVDEVYTKILNLTETGQYEELCEYMSDVGLNYIDDTWYEEDRKNPNSAPNRSISDHKVLMRDFPGYRTLSQRIHNYHPFHIVKDGYRLVDDNYNVDTEELLEYEISMWGEETEAGIYVSDVKLEPVVGTIVYEQVMDDGMYFYVVVPGYRYESDYSWYTIFMKTADSSEEDNAEVIEEQEVVEEPVVEDETTETVLGGPYVGTWVLYHPESMGGGVDLRIQIYEDGTGSFEFPQTYGHLRGNLVATDEKRNIFKCSAFIDDNGTLATDVTIRFTGEGGNVTAYYEEAGTSDGEIEYPVVRE